VSSTRLIRHIRAPRGRVYEALLDAEAVQRWMVPDSMTSHVHSFDARPGGEFRVSLTYRPRHDDAPTGTGKTSAKTDTYHGRFVSLVPDTEVVQVLEFETDDPAMRGEMIITLTLADAYDGGTSLTGVHQDLPPGVVQADNELGWSMSLEKLAKLVEDGAAPVTEVPLAEAFTYPGVVSAYRYRPPYPDSVFDVLTGLITDMPRTVLDLGAGEGALARPLAPLVDQVDALDVSVAMISAGRLRPGGDAPNLRWIVGAAETAPLGGPYALVTAGASMHWMRWRETFKRLAGVMTGSAFLAIVGHGYEDPPWTAELDKVIARHSRSPAYDPSFRLVDSLGRTRLFDRAGQVAAAPEPFRQRTVDYVEYLHSTSSLAREWMPPEEAAAFDRAITEIVAPYETDGWLDLTVLAEVTWGRVAVTA
jgi:uncharacterized protein YndB with AHSA1/START domain/SAM-dependent methyltransferase